MLSQKLAVVLFGTAVSALIVGYALTRGDPQVRAAAGFIGGDALLSPAVQDLARWTDPQHRLLELDGACTVALVWVTMRRPRDWSIAATAWLLLATLSDAIAPLDITIGAKTWLLIMMFYGWAAQACLLWGAIVRPDFRFEPRRPKVGSPAA